MSRQENEVKNPLCLSNFRTSRGLSGSFGHEQRKKIGCRKTTKHKQETQKQTTQNKKQQQQTKQTNKNKDNRKQNTKKKQRNRSTANTRSRHTGPGKCLDRKNEVKNPLYLSNFRTSRGLSGSFGHEQRKKIGSSKTTRSRQKS